MDYKRGYIKGLRKALSIIRESVEQIQDSLTWDELVGQLSKHDYDVSVRMVGFENHPILSKVESTEEEQSDSTVEQEHAVYLTDNSGPEYYQMVLGSDNTWYTVCLYQENGQILIGWYPDSFNGDPHEEKEWKREFGSGHFPCRCSFDGIPSGKCLVITKE